MNNRIAEILKNEGLTNSQFASLIGVQASAITHILNGRNEPSLKVIKSILDNFRQYNPDWLISGKGAMYRKSTEVSENKEDNTPKKVMHPVQQSLFPEYPVSTPEYGKENELNAEANLDDSNNTSTINNASQDVASVTQPQPQVAAMWSNPVQTPTPQQQTQQADPQTMTNQSVPQQPISGVPYNNYAPYGAPYVMPGVAMPMGQPMVDKKEEKLADPVPPRKVKKIIVFYSDGSYEEYGAQLNIN